MEESAITKPSRRPAERAFSRRPEECSFIRQPDDRSLTRLPDVRSFPRRTGALAAAALVTASLTLPGSPVEAGSLYAHFLFFPRKEIHHQPDSLAGVPRQDVTINVGKNKQLSGWFFHNPASPNVVLVSHGNGGNISSLRWIAENLLSTGASVLLYDYQGYGNSPGHPSARGICEDGDAAWDFLVTEKNYRPDQIFLYGQSLGCAVASHIASTHTDAAGLILQSGFSSLRHVAAQHFSMLKYTQALLVPDVLNNTKILAQSKMPLLIIHGDQDEIVPFDNAHLLYDAAIAPKELVVCKGSGHRLYPEACDQHRTAVTKFISGILAARNTAPSDSLVAATKTPDTSATTPAQSQAAQPEATQPEATKSEASVAGEKVAGDSTAVEKQPGL